MLSVSYSLWCLLVECRLNSSHIHMQPYLNIGQSGILPTIQIQGLEINILAIAISITKQLTATTLNEMWDGSDEEDGLALLKKLTIPGEQISCCFCAHDVHFFLLMLITIIIHSSLLPLPRSLRYARNRRFWFNLEFEDQALSIN